MFSYLLLSAWFTDILVYYHRHKWWNEILTELSWMYELLICNFCS